MERSSKFISVSGLAGILAGLYALIGVRMAMRITTNHIETGSPVAEEPLVIRVLIFIALAVLVLSLATSYMLTVRKAKRRNENVWNPVSKRLLIASGIPFFTGGLFISILGIQHMYAIIPAACLIFYGLALVAGSQFTFQEVGWLGIAEILLGLMAMLYPADGLVYWAIGFGLLHIIYGTFMHFKYER